MSKIKRSFSPMKTLLLVRHAKSSWDDAAMPDFKRPLNARGLKDAGEMAMRLKSKINTLHLLVSSPALRAKTTAGIFLETFALNARHLLLEDSFYLAPPAVFEQYIRTAADLPDTIAIFAHNPGITDFANSLTRSIKTDNIPTCGIFAISAAIAHWSDFTAAEKTFLFYDYPKLGS
jgi:phosphohistidine phosphatase